MPSQDEIRRVSDILEECIEPVGFDLIAAKAGLTVGETVGSLLYLELKGEVIQLPGKVFMRRKSNEKGVVS